MADSWRDSTTLIYCRKWAKFCKWVKRRGHTLSNITPARIATYLWTLFNRGLALSTINGYRAAINAVMRWVDPSIIVHPLIVHTIKAFKRSRPVVRTKTPSWDVQVVLKHLASAAYEPLDKVPIRQVLKKALFLLAIASARRTGELQAISSNVSFTDSGMTCTYLPEFVAKTESRANPLPRSFMVPSLSQVVGQVDEEQLYCPVRAIRHYLLTLGRMGYGYHRRLFRSLRDPSKPLPSNHLSYLIREVIKQAHVFYSNANLPAIRVRAYETRAMAASLNVSYNMSFRQILSYGIWRTPSVFVRHYLRDVPRGPDGVFSLGPVVAGGSVIA